MTPTAGTKVQFQSNGSERLKQYQEVLKYPDGIKPPTGPMASFVWWARPTDMKQYDKVLPTRILVSLDHQDGNTTVDPVTQAKLVDHLRAAIVKALEPKAVPFGVIAAEASVLPLSLSVTESPINSSMDKRISRSASMPTRSSGSSTWQTFRKGTRPQRGKAGTSTGKVSSRWTMRRRRSPEDGHSRSGGIWTKRMRRDVPVERITRLDEVLRPCAATA